VDARTTGPRRSDHPLIVQGWDLGTGTVSYHDAWEEQRRLHALRSRDEGADTVLLLEHAAVYTAGKRTQADERPVDGTPVVDVDRGGKITYHGPGQLVGYPVLRLPGHVYVVDHVRRMEEALVRTCADFGLTAGRVHGRSGVWLPADPSTGRPERKVAAIGVRVARGVTMHGFALNCDVDLGAYQRIVPCGIRDAGVSSLSAELGRRVDVASAAAVLEPHLRELFSWREYDRAADLPRPAAQQGPAERVAAQGTVPVGAAS
jgi:lipoyl(octanoyl) transferase